MQPPTGRLPEVDLLEQDAGDGLVQVLRSALDTVQVQRRAVDVSEFA